MARPREFDTDETLAKAMDVFWERGYGASTMPELLAGMNLTRGSLYKAFRDKKSLFLLVLGKYDEQVVSDAVTLLSDSGQDGWDRILAVFDSIVDAVESGDRRGCLLCSAVAGPAGYDTDIAAYAFKSLGRLRTAFQLALDASGVTDDAEPMSHFLVTQYVGLRIMSRTSISVSNVRQNVLSLRILSSRH